MKDKSQLTRQQRRAKRNADKLSRQQEIIPATKPSIMFLRVVGFYKTINKQRNAYSDLTEELAQCRQDMQNLQKEIAFTLPGLYETATLLFFKEFYFEPKMALQTYHHASSFKSNHLTAAEQQKVSDIYNRTIVIAKLILQQKLHTPRNEEKRFLTSRGLKKDFFSELTTYQPIAKTPAIKPPPMAMPDLPKRPDPGPSAPPFQIIAPDSKRQKRKKALPEPILVDLEAELANAANTESTSKNKEPNSGFSQ